MCLLDYLYLTIVYVCVGGGVSGTCRGSHDTPNLPTKIIPTKIG